MSAINVIGGGLAGCEAAYRLAREGFKVKLYEMRPGKMTPVHQTDRLAELVCSNSLKSELPFTAQGLLKQEMKILGSLLLDCAEQCRVPAGSALAVDREMFASLVTKKIKSEPNINLINEEITLLPENEVTVVASGPLTSDTLCRTLQDLTGEENLHFFDAVAPSVTEESLNKESVFKASRYGKGDDDYYNCPMSMEQYETFYQNLINADIREGHLIDKKQFFSGCMPVEVIARQGKDSLRFGPMRPVGLEVPGTGKRAYAVVQLRQEDRDGRVYGLVGFQTRLKWGAQDQVFRLIPGLEHAEFVRYGVMHRNTYINSPQLLLPTLQLKRNSNIFWAGQITGVEGYMESAATGILAAINVSLHMRREPPAVLSPLSMLGSLVKFITSASSSNFQPINANFGMLPPLDLPVKDKKIRYEAYFNRATKEVTKFSELYTR